MRKHTATLAIWTLVGFLLVSGIQAQQYGPRSGLHPSEAGGGTDANAVQKVDTQADLLALPSPVDGDQASTAGRATVADGNGRVFTYHTPPVGDTPYAATINTGTNAITVTQGDASYGLGQKVLLDWTGQPTSTPQVAKSTIYYVNGLSGGTFTLSDTAGGATINFTTTGSGFTVAIADDGWEFLADENDTGNWVANKSGTNRRKGALLAGDGVKTGEIEVGTDGQILVADSTALTGLSWQDHSHSFAPVDAQYLLQSANVNLPNAVITNFTGGNAGQVLKKASGANYDWIWANESGGGIGSPLTTKGDLWGHTGAIDTRFPIGAQGQVLTVDPNSSVGFTWQTPVAVESTPRIFQNVAAAVAATDLINDQAVYTLGYYAANDSGSNSYRYSSTNVGAADGGFIIDVTSGGQLVAANQSVANARRFGCVGDGTTDDAARIAAMRASGAPLHFPRGNYRDGSLVIFGGDGETAGITVLEETSVNVAGIYRITFQNLVTPLSELTGGEPGQVVVIEDDKGAGMTHTPGQLELAGGRDFAEGPGTSVTLRYTNNVWREVSRMREADGLRPIHKFDSLGDAIVYQHYQQRDVVQTSGYYVPSDSGGNTYAFSSTQSLPEDGGHVINVTSGGQLIATDRSRVTAKTWGCYGDNLNSDVNRLDAALEASGTLKVPCYIEEGEYLINGTLNVNTGPLEIIGLGNAKLNVTAVGNNGWAFSLVGDLSIRGVEIDGGDVANCSWLIVSTPTSRVLVEDCKFGNMNQADDVNVRSTAALRIGNSTPESIVVRGCRFDDLRAKANDIKGDAPGSVRGISSSSNPQLFHIEDCFFQNIHSVDSAGGGTIVWEDADAIELSPVTFQQNVVINNCRFNVAGKRAARINKTYLTQVSDCTMKGLADDSPRAMVEVFEGRCEIDNCRYDGAASQYFAVIADKGVVGDLDSELVVSNCEHAPEYASQVRDVNTGFVLFENARHVGVNNSRCRNTEVVFNAHVSNTSDPELSIKGSSLPSNLKFFDGATTARLLEPLSVATTGAKGDGVTDDTAALLAAHEAARPTDEVNATGAGTVYYPVGHYITNAPLPVYSGMNIRGANMKQSRIAAGPTFTAANGDKYLLLLTASTLNPGAWNVDVVISDMYLTSDDNTDIGAIGDSAFMATNDGYVVEAVIERVRTNANYGIILDYYAQNCVIRDAQTGTPQEQGIHVAGNQNLIENVHVNQNVGSRGTTEAMVEIKESVKDGGAGVGNQLVHVTIEGQGHANKNTLELNKVRNTTLDHVWYEALERNKTLQINDSDSVTIKGMFSLGDYEPFDINNSTVTVENFFDKRGGFRAPLQQVEIDEQSLLTIKQWDGYYDEQLFDKNPRINVLAYGDAVHKNGSGNAAPHDVLARGGNVLENPSFEAGEVGWNWISTPDHTTRLGPSPFSSGKTIQLVDGSNASKSLETDGFEVTEEMVGKQLTFTVKGKLHFDTTYNWRNASYDWNWGGGERYYISGPGLTDPGIATKPATVLEDAEDGQGFIMEERPESERGTLKPGQWAWVSPGTSGLAYWTVYVRLTSGLNPHQQGDGHMRGAYVENTNGIMYLTTNGGAGLSASDVQGRVYAGKGWATMIASYTPLSAEGNLRMRITCLNADGMEFDDAACYWGSVAEPSSAMHAQALEMTGNLQRYGAGPPTAATEAGTKGDILWNNAPVDGGPIGWRCITTGMPGTWVAISDSGVVNVKDYGAKGDGTTDDTAAIIAARDAAGVNGTVYFPNGVYKVSQELQLLDRQTWRCERHEAILYADPTLNGNTGIDGAVLHVTPGLADCTINGFWIKGRARCGVRVSGSTATPTVGVDCLNVRIRPDAPDWDTFDIAVDVYGQHKARYVNIEVEGTVNDTTGICFAMGGGAADGYITNTLLENCYTNELCDTNLRIGKAGVYHASVIEVSTFAAQGGRIGVDASHAQDCVFNGLYTENCVHPVVLGTVDQTGQTRAITFNSARLDGPLSAHPAYAQRNAAVTINSASGVTFNACKFGGCTQASRMASLNTSTLGGGGAGSETIPVRCNADGTVHSLELLNGGSGFTADGEVLGVPITGEGTGATATVNLSGGVITSVALTAPGSGYLPNTTGTDTLPVAILYHTAIRTSFRDSFFPVDAAAAPQSMFPFVVRHSGAGGVHGVRLENDVLVHNPVGGGGGGTAPLTLTQGNNFNHSHALVWQTWTGSAYEQKTSIYTPPVYP